jgi:hypothetical protein
MVVVFILLDSITLSMEKIERRLAKSESPLRLNASVANNDKKVIECLSK